MVVRSRVDVNSYFPQITAQVNELARQAVAEAATAGARQAASVASERSRTGHMAAMVASPALASTDGFEAWFKSPAFYALFHEYGTLGSRRKPLKRPPSGKRTREPGTGIEPLRFLAAGRREGRKAMLRRIEQGLPR